MKPILVGVALLLIGAFAIQKIAERHGEANTELKQAQDQTKQGEKTLAHIDTVYRSDTVRLTREVKKYQTLRDTTRITDTVWVKEFVKQSDSTIHACLLTVQTCEQKDSAHKVIEAGLRKQNDALKKLLPTRTERLLTAAKWAGVGFIVGKAVR